MCCVASLSVGCMLSGTPIKPSWAVDGTHVPARAQFRVNDDSGGHRRYGGLSSDRDGEAWPLVKSTADSARKRAYLHGNGDFLTFQTYFIRGNPGRRRKPLDLTCR
jgi:hypothetical protein